MTRWKFDNYVLILRKIYWRTFSNTCGKTLKIVTNKNSAKILYKYGNMYGNAYGHAFYNSISAHSYTLIVYNINDEFLKDCYFINSASKTMSSLVPNKIQYIQ